MLIVSSLTDVFEESLQVSLKDSALLVVSLESTLDVEAALAPSTELLPEWEDSLLFVSSWRVLNVG